MPYTHKTLEMSPPTWNHNFWLGSRSYSVSNIHDYFEYLIKKKKIGEETNNPSIRVYVNQEKKESHLKSKLDITSNF